MPLPPDKLVRGNAYTDGVPREGWFVAGFIDETFGLRCRRGRQFAVDAASADFEVKLKRHASGDGERRLFPFNRTATSLSVLMGEGRFELFLCHGAEWDHVTLSSDGDYALWGPGVGHLWMVPLAATVLTVRVPGIPGDQDQTPLDQLPAGVTRYFDERELRRREALRVGG